MSRLVEEKNKKENKLMTFTVGNEEVKLSHSIVKNYLVNGQADKLTDQEIVYFMHLCKARKLNPFTKEVYLIKYGNQPATMVVSRDALEKRAIKHEKYNGKKVGIYIVDKETGKLEKRERQIIMLRYFEDRTQSEIGELLNISQVQVSRIEKKVLSKLKSYIS